jgi:uncharacterized membrane protein YoaK (UPF0700 family)
MTGNVVFLGFGIAEVDGPDVMPVIVAVATFTAGPTSGCDLRHASINLVHGRRR